MPTKAKNDPQIGMEDRWIEDQELQGWLEDRADYAETLSDYRALQDKIKVRLEEHYAAGLLNTPARVGAFLVSSRETTAGTVEFERKAGHRFAIKTVAGSDTGEV